MGVLGGIGLGAVDAVVSVPAVGEVRIPEEVGRAAFR